MSKNVGNGLNLQGQRIQGLGDGSSPNDAVTLNQLQNMLRGLSFKDPVRAATTTSLNLSAPGATIDGVTMAPGDSFLDKDNSTGSSRGIYIWNGASSPATRRADADNGTELRPGVCVTVTEGTTNGDKLFAITSDSAITIGTTAMTWTVVAGGGQSYTASNGVQLVGSDFRGVAATGGGLTVGAAGFSIDASVVTRKVSGNMGNGSLTSIPVTHNLGTTDVYATAKLNATGEDWIVDWVPTDANTVTFTFPSAPAAGAYRYSIFG